MIRNWYNQIPYPAFKTKREITKNIDWQQFTKGTRGKPNEQLFPRQPGSSNFTITCTYVTDYYMSYIRIKWLSIDTVGEGKSILSAVCFNIKHFIFPLDFYYWMNKVKTGHPDSDKAQVIGNITLK